MIDVLRKMFSAKMNSLYFVSKDSLESMCLAKNKHIAYLLILSVQFSDICCVYVIVLPSSFLLPESTLHPKAVFTKP